MYSFKFNCLKICDLLEIAEMNKECLASLGDYFLDECWYEQEINAWLNALRLRLDAVKGVDLLFESMYSAMLKDAFKKRDEIRKRSNFRMAS